MTIKVEIINGVWMAYKTLDGLTGIGLSPYLALLDYFEAEKLWGNKI
jgi:hypothetical protein